MRDVSLGGMAMLWWPRIVTVSLCYRDPKFLDRQDWPNSVDTDTTWFAILSAS